jgi:hypothetical protein
MSESNIYNSASQSLQHNHASQSIQIKKCHRHLGCWSVCYYLLMCRRAHSVVNDQTPVYEKPTSIKEHQNE